MMYERNSVPSSTHCLPLTSSQNFSNFDCHSIALNDKETHLLLVGAHGLVMINLEKRAPPSENNPRDETNFLMPNLSDVHFLQLFDACNVNRPIVQWNHSEPNQCAVAIDRLVRLYKVGHGGLQETDAIIDSRHQRPISTLSYSPHDATRLLTGSLDGQIQVWDIRQCSSKSPASLKFSASTPFSIRRMQWSSNRSDNSNQLAIQCDRCIRIYDIRRADSQVLSFHDLESSQRIVNMDWTQHERSVVSLANDQLIRIHSATGQVLAESMSNESLPFLSSTIRSTLYDNLFVCAARDTSSSTFGFVGWRCDEDQCLRPLTDRIVSTTPSPIVDFCFITDPGLLHMFYKSSASEMAHAFLLLAWCRDGQLCLVEMDSTFRQAWNNQNPRAKTSTVSDSTRIVSRQHLNRGSVTLMPMDVIKDEMMDDVVELEDEHCFEGMSSSPSNTIESPETDEDNDFFFAPDRKNNSASEVSIENELSSLHDSYGLYIVVETKDVARRMCLLRCTYSLEDSLFFRIYLILSRHYPIISQLFVRFKMSTSHIDERVRSLQTRIQLMFDQSSHQYFYQGQLCLHRCLVKLKNMFDAHYRQERSLSKSSSVGQKNRDQSRTNSDLESPSPMTTSSSIHNQTSNGNRVFNGSSSSTRTSDSQMSLSSFQATSRRTCGARFSGTTQLICFGRIANNQTAPSIAASAGATIDSAINRPQSLPMRSTSLTATKTRENSHTDEHASYRPTPTNTVQIQQHSSNNQRLPMFSAPVRSSLSTSLFNDHQHRMGSSYRYSVAQRIHPPSSVSIYDVTILLPISKKLADDYQIDLNNSMEMCESNEQLTSRMAKGDLAQCWSLLAGLLSIEPNLQTDDSWFQTPIAQGLIKHLVSNYVRNGDIQSASMFLLTMSQSPFLKTKIQSRLVNEHDHDPILYAYASLLHRWKHFYKRTQILSQIDHNCQSPAPFNQPTGVMIICVICSQPVLGQYFLCAVCGHGGHLTHMHDWFSSEEVMHQCCPEKECPCRCVTKQQEALTNNALQMQQQQFTSTSTARTYLARQPSGNVRPL